MRQAMPRFPLLHLSVLTAVLAGCTARAEQTGAAGAAAAAKPSPVKSWTAPSAEERARGLLERQVKALPSDDAILLSTFVPGTVAMLQYRSVKVDEPNLELGAQIAGLHPHA